MTQRCSNSPATRVPRRHRFRRLCVRHDGAEAQGVLHSRTSINYYDLQGVSKYAREAAEFVNLYSKSRGINRFPALVEELEWLRSGPR